MATESTTDFTLDSAAALAADEQGEIEGKSPWLLAWRRLRRNYVALAFLGLFVLIVVACLLAGPYAEHVAKTGPNEGHLGETFTRDGKQVQIVSKGGFVGDQFVAGGIPVGPQLWHAGGRYVFGADNQGRDVAVRLLYGGLNSLKVGIGSALICVALALFFALLAGYYGGWVDWVLSRFFDLIWAFPVLLLAIALGTALAINGFHHFGINIEAGSLWIPTFVISFVLIPYVARPLRGQILSLREKEFVEAASAQGASPLRIMFGELLPERRLVGARLPRADDREQHPHRGGPLLPRRRRPASRTRRGGRSSTTAPPVSSRRPGSRSSPASRSCSRSFPSTSSATACATRSIRARRSGWSTSKCSPSSSGG